MYHAHLYFDHNSPSQYKVVEEVVEKIKENFDLPVGHIHGRPVGPHPVGSCQVLFKESDYEDFTQWLKENRQGLDVMIHPVTGDEYVDHTENVSWIGGSHSLILSIFTRNKS